MINPLLFFSLLITFYMSSYISPSQLSEVSRRTSNISNSEFSVVEGIQAEAEQSLGDDSGKRVVYHTNFTIVKFLLTQRF